MSVERVEQGSGGVVVVVAGDVDLTLSADLDSAIEWAAAAAPDVIVDLAQATLIDSRAIGVLLGWAERLRGRDARLSIVGCKPDVLRLFTTIGLDREFDFYETRDDALAKAP